MSLVNSNVNYLKSARTKKGFKYRRQMMMKPGLLYPVLAFQIFEPGTTKQINLAGLARALALKNASLGSTEITFDAYCVPWRLIWDRSKQFFGENDSQAWTTSFDEQFPYESFDMENVYDPSSNVDLFVANDTIGVQLGLPIFDYGAASISKYPASATLNKRAYVAIWNRYYCNHNITDDVLYTKGYSGNLDAYKMDSQLLPVMKNYDAITGITPAPQKGPALNIPAGSLALVGSLTTAGTAKYPNPPTSTDVNGGNSPVYADLANALGGISLRDIRNTALTQQLYEKLVNAPFYGDITDAIYGVRASSDILDEPQFLGSYHSGLNTTTVTATAEGTNIPLGFQGGKSETQFGGSVFDYTATEHCVVMVVAYIRQSEHVYANFLKSEYMIKDYFDVPNPMWAHSGDVPVRKVNVFVDPDYGIDEHAGLISSAGEQMLGDQEQRTDWYQEATILGYQEYGWYMDYPLSEAVGLMNPYFTDSFKTFTSADAFGSTPSLTTDFIKENPHQTIARNFVDPDNPYFVCEFVFYGDSIRVAPASIPGITRL